MNMKDLQVAVRKYTQPDVTRSTWQLLNTVLPYFMLWGMMVASVILGLPLWVTLLLIPVTTIFHIRSFIIFHDCCHRSFFKSQAANRWLGTIIGVMTFTAYDAWAGEHLTHHSSVADLSRRGTGDIWTMTVNEYQAASRWKRLLYRAFRNPFVLFGLGPIWVFFIFNRTFQKGMSKRERWSIAFTNIAIVGVALILSLVIGWQNYLLIKLPVIYLSGVFGIWLFYVQHQFDPTHWYDPEDWDFFTASLHSSSYYKLPKVLQWISGNIGLHHVHHVNARIPNYHLQACLDNTPELQTVKPMTLLDSLKTIRMNLWDEEKQKLVSFGSLRTVGQAT